MIRRARNHTENDCQCLETLYDERLLEFEDFVMVRLVHDEKQLQREVNAGDDVAEYVHCFIV